MMPITDDERELARKIVDAVHEWDDSAEMVSPNVERLLGIDYLVEKLRKLGALSEREK